MIKRFLPMLVLVAYICSVLAIFNSYPIFSSPPLSKYMPFVTIRQYVLYVWMLIAYGCLSGVVILVFPAIACWCRFGGRLLRPLFLSLIAATILIEVVAGFKVGIELPLTALRIGASIRSPSTYLFLAVLEAVWYEYLLPVFVPLVSAEIVLGFRRLRAVGIKNAVLYGLLCLVILRLLYFALSTGIDLAIGKALGKLATLLYFRGLNPELAKMIASGELEVRIFIPSIGWLISTVVTLYLAYLACSRMVSKASGLLQQ